jgi:hypothetical protein
MKKINYLYFILFFGCIVNAQTTVILDSNNQNLRFYDYNNQSVVFTVENTDVTIGGILVSAEEIIFRPNASNFIRLVEREHPGGGGGGTGTTVKNSKPPTGGSGENPNTVSIYPNPVATILYFKSEYYRITSYIITRVSTAGEVRNVSITPTFEGNIDVSNLVNDMYSLRLNLEGGQSIVSKFIKN